MQRKGKKKMIKRDEVKQKLIEMGIAEPTEEQVNSYIAVISNELKASEDRAARFKAESDKVKDLEKQLNELNNAKLTDEERSAKAVEEANQRVLELETTVKTMQLQKSLAEIGIVGEDATDLVGEDGNLNVEKLGQIIGAREKSAVDVYKKQALDDTPAPDGKKGSEGEDDDKGDPLTKDIVDRAVASKKAETEAVSIIDSYK